MYPFLLNYFSLSNYTSLFLFFFKYPSSPSFTSAESHQDPCMNNLCENGATCQADSVGGYKCICRDGFEGRYCQGNSNESHC